MMLHQVFMNNILNIDFDSISNVLSKLFILAAVVMILKEISNPSKNYQTVIPKLPKKRKEFSEKTKKSALFRQGYRCNSCLKPLQNIQDFHHRNGNRADNCSNNCEALCPNCHAKKTRKSMYY